jgi:GT2 family glycosyltransferase
VIAGPSSAIRVAVILVNWKGWRECIECVDTVLAQQHTAVHIFIVDNDSPDDSVERIVEWCANPVAGPEWRRHDGVDRLTDLSPSRPIQISLLDRGQIAVPESDGTCRVTLIRAGDNAGFASGCNAGVTAAGLDNFEYFWFLNPDTVVDRNALVELIKRAQQDAKIGIVGSTLIFYDAPQTVQALGGGCMNLSNAASRHVGEGSPVSDVSPDGTAVERELAFISGASMLVSGQFIREIGPMQEDYFLYYEEIDWATRGLKRFTLGFAPRSHVFHKSGANSSQIMPLFTARYFYRNRLRFVRRFLPDRMSAAKRTLFVEMLRHVVRRRWGLARVVGATLLNPPEA